MTVNFLTGDCRELLKTMPDESVQCVVTSPPYYGLRDYGVDGQIGLEQTPDEYIAEMVGVFREVRRVLRSDGTVWLNLGDSFEDKQLMGIPWRVAFALQADGWYLRQDIIWHKPNPMPESVTDRCTKAHEYIFLLSKSARYYYDNEAIKVPVTNSSKIRLAQDIESKTGTTRANGGLKTNGNLKAVGDPLNGRNRRSVWTISTKPFKEAHFATFPPELAEICIKAGTSEKGACSECGAPWERVVEKTPMEVRSGPTRKERSQNGQLRTQINGTMTKPPKSRTVGWKPICKCEASIVPCITVDPFSGAGTTGFVANRLGRDAILIELNPDYVEIARQRIIEDAPLFADIVTVGEF